MVRSAIQTQLKDMNPQQRVAWKTSIDINWSMSRENSYFCIQDMTCAVYFFVLLYRYFVWEQAQQ
jgi:hypothetical protein